MANNTTLASFPALAALANGSEFLLTSELAQLMKRATQTIRKSYSQSGHFLGLVPVKSGNLLQWWVCDVQKYLEGQRA